VEQQWCHDDGRRVHVLIVRRFEAPKYTLGVGQDPISEPGGVLTGPWDGAWFVYHRSDEDGQWHCHVGPYTDMAQAVSWINDIRVGAPAQGSRRNG
jgi:hypothetical protein